MSNSNGQGIGCIGRRGFGESENGSDHEGDLVFLRASASDHGLFDQTRGVFMHFESVGRGDDERGASGRAHDDGRADILHIDHTLDGEGGGLVGGGDATESLVNLPQAVVGGELGRVGHHTVGDGAEFAVGQLEHGVAGPAE